MAFFFHEMRRKILEHFVKTWMIEGRRNRRKQGEKMLDALKKEAQSRKRDRSTENDKWQRCMKGDDCVS